MPTQLEQEFHQAMIDIYEKAKDEADYVAKRYYQMLEDHRGVETAKWKW